MKELIIWGTLDPVAAHLLSHGLATTRADAEEMAEDYLSELERPDNPDDIFNAVTIRNWASKFEGTRGTANQLPPSASFQVQLMRNFSNVHKNLRHVIPVEVANDILWFDPAGFPLARSVKPYSWQSTVIDTHDFMLNVSQQLVSSSLYI